MCVIILVYVSIHENETKAHCLSEGHSPRSDSNVTVKIMTCLMRSGVLATFNNLHLFLPLCLPCSCAKNVSAYEVGEQSNGHEVKHEKG